MKALLFLTMLIAFVCYVREAETKRDVAEKNSGKLSNVLAEIKSRRGKRQSPFSLWDKECSFILHIRGDLHYGYCEVKVGEAGARIHCHSDNKFPDGPRSFYSTGRGNCSEKYPEDDDRCEFRETVKEDRVYYGKCFSPFNGTCYVGPGVEQKNDPAFTGPAPECNAPATLPVFAEEEKKQEEEKKDEKEEEYYEKKSSKVKA